METITYTSVRANLAKKMDDVCENHEPIVITRSGNESVVMISLEDYEAIEETHYLMKGPVNAKRLASSIDEIEKMIAKKS